MLDSNMITSEKSHADPQLPLQCLAIKIFYFFKYMLRDINFTEPNREKDSEDVLLSKQDER